MAPATFVVTLIMVAAIAIGVFILAHAKCSRGRDRKRRSADATQSACPYCKLLNPTHATYCGHCGKALH